MSDGASNPPPPTKRKHVMSVDSALRFVNDALGIRGEDAVSADTIGFMARMLVQATMPHSPSDSRSYTRKNGALVVEMSLTPRQFDELKRRLPYGTYPRLIMAWVTTEAVRTKSPKLELGDSLSSFMRQLGLEATGGKKGQIQYLRQHLTNLFSTQISWSYSGPGEDVEVSLVPVEGKHIWWDPAQPTQTSLWHSVILLNQRFYESIIERPVPVDMRAMRALAGTRSAFALDIYTWLTYRLSYLDRDQMIRWPTLQQQFGGEFKRTIDFRRRFVQRLRFVQELYPAARVFPAEDGVLLRPSPPHVPLRLLK